MGIDVVIVLSDIILIFGDLIGIIIVIKLSCVIIKNIC